MADINAEIADRVLGWHRQMWPLPNERPYWADSKGECAIGFRCWNPTESIGQCFEYVIPAMRGKGAEFDMTIVDERVSVFFFEPVSQKVVGCCEIPDPTKAAECIVQAALKAVAAMEEQGNGR